MTFSPIMNPVVLVVLAIALVAAYVFFVFRNARKNDKLRFVDLGCVIMSVVLLVGIGLRPQLPGGEEEVLTSAKNTNVVFVVDTTISMWAGDGTDGKTRMQQFHDDLEHITGKLAGCRFALVTFDDIAMMRLPFSTDAVSLEDALLTVSRPSEYSAKGTSLNTPLAEILRTVKRSESKPGNKTVVVFVSDGEITDGSSVQGYEQLRNQISDGIVLGYGTAAGGTMTGDSGPLMDTSANAPAISKYDEGNLQAVASQMGVEYFHISDNPSAADFALQRIEDAATAEGEESDVRYVEFEIYPYLAGVLAIVLLAEAVLILRNRRIVKVKGGEEL